MAAPMSSDGACGFRPSSKEGATIFLGLAPSSAHGGGTGGPALLAGADAGITEFCSSASSAPAGGTPLANAPAGQLVEDEIICKPMPLVSGGSTFQWEGLRHALPEPCWKLLNGEVELGDGMAGIQLSMDHHTSCWKLLAHLENIAPINVLVGAGFCKQHATGLAMARPIKTWDILCPIFCLVKLLRKNRFWGKVEEGAMHALRKNFCWIKQEEVPNWRPHPADLEHAERVLETCYYTRELRSSRDDNDDAKMREEEQKRRALGQRLKDHCPGNWRKKNVVHWCKGCCDNWEEAVAHTYQLIMSVVFTMLGIPAANKWLSLWPTASDAALMLNFHKIFHEALRYACGFKLDDSLEAVSDISEADLLGCPDNGQQAWKREESRKARKVLRWTEEPAHNIYLLAYLVTCGHVMRLHYSLFKWGHRCPMATTRSYVFDLCDSHKSVATKVLGELGKMIFHGQGWALIEDIIGPYQTWPPHIKSSIEHGTLQLYSQVWRRLLHWFLEQWPWKLVCVADPECPRDRKWRVIGELFAAPESVLDSTSLKIRKCAGSPEALLHHWWQVFLYNFFNKTAVSNAFLECMFAQIKQLCHHSPKPLSAALVQAKQLCRNFQRANAAKRKWEETLALPNSVRVPSSANRTKRPRPAWVIRKGEQRGCDARNEYCAKVIRERPDGETQQDAMIRACQEWGNTVANEQEDHRRKGKAEQITKRISADQRMQLATEDPGPATSVWGTSDGCPHFSLAAETIRRQMELPGGVKAAAAKHTAHARPVSEPSRGGLPTTSIPFRPPTPESIQRLSDIGKKCHEELLTLFALMFGPRGKKKEMQRAPMLVACSSCSLNVIIRCTSFLTPITGVQAEFVLYSVVTADGVRDAWTSEPINAPCEAVLRQEEYLGDGPALLCPMVECDLLATCITRAQGGEPDARPGPWTFQKLDSRGRCCAGCKYVRDPCDGHWRDYRHRAREAEAGQRVGTDQSQSTAQVGLAAVAAGGEKEKSAWGPTEKESTPLPWRNRH